MAIRDKIVPAIVTVLVGVSGWVWSLYSDLDSRSMEQEKQVAILYEKKADKEHVNRLEIQLERQTVILENQSKLMEQQHELLKGLVEGQ